MAHGAKDSRYTVSYRAHGVPHVAYYVDYDEARSCFEALSQRTDELFHSVSELTLTQRCVEPGRLLLRIQELEDETRSLKEALHLAEAIGDFPTELRDRRALQEIADCVPILTDENEALRKAMPDPVVLARIASELEDGVVKGARIPSLDLRMLWTSTAVKLRELAATIRTALAEAGDPAGSQIKS